MLKCYFASPELPIISQTDATFQFNEFIETDPLAFSWGKIFRKVGQW